MQKIKDKIEKLLRLSMSNSPHEAKLAAQKAIELMNKHSLTREDIDKNPIIIKHIEVDYARVPGWYCILFQNIANIKYYVDVLQREIQKRAKIFIKNVTGEREMVKSYRMGLVNGIYNILYKASQIFNEKLKDNAIIPVDTRVKEAKKFYHQKHRVKSIATDFKLNIYYIKGLEDAENISVTSPISMAKKQFVTESLACLFQKR